MQDNEPTGGDNVKLAKIQIVDTVKVGLQRHQVDLQDASALDIAIRNATEAIDPDEHAKFIDEVLCQGEWNVAVERPSYEQDLHGRYSGQLPRPDIYGPDAWNILMLATKIFLLLRAGVVRKTQNGIELIDQESWDQQKDEELLGHSLTEQSLGELLKRYFGQQEVILPYYNQIVENLPSSTVGSPYCKTVLLERLRFPAAMELMFDYWLILGGVRGAMNGIVRRFINLHGPTDVDPLANFETSPLQPLSLLLGGYVQTEYQRLPLSRFDLEAQHQYGFTLGRKVVNRLRPADARFKFRFAFHDLLTAASRYYQESANTTIIPDTYPLFLKMQQVNQLLAESSGNNWLEVTFQSRAEMLSILWLMSRPEMTRFLHGRPMESQKPWEQVINDYNRLHGVEDTSIIHYHKLAKYGEQICLMLRLQAWNHPKVTPEYAKATLDYWRFAFKGYMNSYQAVTGVDLTADATDARDAEDRHRQPSALIERRLAAGRPKRLVAAHATAELSAYEMRDYQRVPAPARRRLLARRDAE